MAYNPKSIADRTELADRLTDMLKTSGFVCVSDETTEDIYEREIPQVSGARVVVYSSIFRGSARSNGADAIRVGVIYRRKDGIDRFLVSEDRVNRTGTVSGIVDRTLARMRNAFYVLRGRDLAGMRCNCCNAPLFTSKAGNEVCVETCWVKQ